MGQIETEVMVASQIIRDPALMYSLTIDRDNIRSPEVRAILRAIEELESERVKYSRLELFRKLPDMKETIREYAAATTSNANFNTHIEEIREFIRIDKISMISDIVNQAIVEGETSGMIVARVELYIAKLDEIETIGDTAGILEVISEALNVLSKKSKTPGIPGVSTGYMKLDTLFGGFIPSRLYYIGARPSEGKTALMLNMFITQMRNSVSAGVISIESTLPELGSRILAIAGDMYAGDIVNGTIKEGTVEDLRVKLKSIAEGSGPFYHNPHASVDETEVQVARMVTKHKVSVVFIDYIQLISGGRFQKRHEEVAHVSRRLKAIALKTGVAIVALAQMRREVDGRKAGMGDFAESSSLEKDADVMMAIVHKDSEGGHETSSIAVLKARDGATGACDVMFSRAKLIFKEL